MFAPRCWLSIAIGCGLTVCAGLLVSGQVPVSPAPAVTEELIAEKDQGAPVDDEEDIVSTDGRQVAWRTPHGKKWVVMLNGARQAGEFDEVRSLTFSRTGDHLAFMARNARTWLMVLDGKEAAQRFDEVGSPVFSPDGARIAYSAKRDKEWLVLGSDAPETPYDGTGLPVFSEDGRHVAFPAKRGGKWLLVSDSKELGPQFDALETVMFSPDGRHLACVGFRSGKRMVALDGKEGPPFDTIGGITFSSDSRRFGYEGADIRTGIMTGKKGRGRVIVDGEVGPQFDGSALPLSDPGALDPTTFSALVPILITRLITRGKLDPVYAGHLLYRFHGVSRPTFSPDGARVAYAARRGKNDEVVIVDGHPGPPYPSIVGGPAFSGDSRHVAFAVSDAGVTTLVIDGERVGGRCSAGTDFVAAITFAPDNRRVGYVGVTGGHWYQIGTAPRAKRRVYVDGQGGTEYDALGTLGPWFSSDSRHVTYVVDGLEEASRNVSLVVTDGAEGKRYDRVWAGTLQVLDTGAVAYVAQAGRKFLRVTQSVQ